MAMIAQSRALLAAPYDSDAQAWRRAVLAQGGAVSAAQQRRVTRLVRALKARGIWTALDRLWIFAAENAVQALTCLRSRTVAVPSSTSPGFTALRGYAGNGASAYIDFGVAASALTNFTQNSAHIGFYVQSGDGVTSLWVGARDSGSGFSSDVNSGTTATGSFSVQSGSSGTSFVQSGQSGMHIVDRQSNTVASWARNGADTDADKTVSTSSGRATSRLTALARNTSGSYAQYSGSRLALVSFGGSLGASGRRAFAVAVNAYMTSVGANTY